MLIDKSYFEGELKVPYDGKEWTEERLDIFIQKYEERLLRDLFGYGLYKEFMEGLQESAVADKWQKLLTGADYTKDGKLKRWDGLIHTMGGAAVQIIRTEPFDIVVGRGGEYDPGVDDDTVLIPEVFQSIDFTIWQRAYGKLRADEYQIVVDDVNPERKLLKLLKWRFEEDDTYTYVAPNSLSIDSDALTYESLIANYVYWHWMADVNTQVTTLGNTKPKAENSDYASPDVKMVRAWNEMGKMIKSLVEFLDENKADYEGWDDQQAANACKAYYRTNIFGI